MLTETRHSLKSNNSFGFDVTAEHFYTAQNVSEIAAAIAWAHDHNKSLHIIGEGSNTVITGDVDGLVLRLGTNRISHTRSDDHTYRVSADAGVNWHQLVCYCLQNNLYGLENLALIPGSVGAAPIQNIGAYGRELAEVVESVEVFDASTNTERLLSRSDCDFSYRDSVFKQPTGRSLIVTRLHLQLSASYSAQTGYAALSHSLLQAGIDKPTADDIFQHICSIRRSKLPDPEHIGNAGSFFKNPVVDAVKLDQLLLSHPQLVSHPQQDGSHKLAAGWLIDNAGWRGYRRGDVGVHDQQALVLVNYGSGTGQQIAVLANDIRDCIRKRFDIALVQEPVFI